MPPHRELTKRDRTLEATGAGQYSRIDSGRDCPWLFEMADIIWSDYLRYRAKQRGFELAIIKEILKFSAERYYDMDTGRLIAVGRHDNRLVVIPYEVSGNFIIPVTVHATTRQQIRIRLRRGRYAIDGSE